MLFGKDGKRSDESAARLFPKNAIKNDLHRQAIFAKETGNKIESGKVRANSILFCHKR